MSTIFESPTAGMPADPTIPPPPTGNKKARPSLPLSEARAKRYARKLTNQIRSKQGLFLRDESGSLHVILEGQRVPLNFAHDNHALAGLMLEACEVTTLSQAAQAAIQRLQVEGLKQAGNMRLRRFAALSDDGHQLYVPLDGGKLLRITADRIEEVPNGLNEYRIWVEHPNEQPIRYKPTDPHCGLAAFERLIVETQACRVPEMRWFVAMDEGLFPYVRDAAPARFILAHIGPTQSGKTSGGQRFTLLHGMGDVKGDYTVAALANLGDIGLLVMDNKEQANFNQPLIDFCLFLATGAERGRSFTDGSMRYGKHRPVGVITTIEGVWKAELKARCVEVQYGVSGPKITRLPIEREITMRRNEITSALLPVLQRYLQIAAEGRPTPNSLPNFEEHFTALSNLLRAYGEVARKPEGWAESIILTWDNVLTGAEIEEDELEHPLLRVFQDADNEMGTGGIAVHEVSWNEKPGRLYVAECGHILMRLQKLNIRDLPLPRNASGLSRRLRSGKFRSFQVLDGESASDLPILKRTANTRPLGFFFPMAADDGMTDDDAVPEHERHHETPCVVGG